MLLGPGGNILWDISIQLPSTVGPSHYVHHQIWVDPSRCGPGKSQGLCGSVVQWQELSCPLASSCPPQKGVYLIANSGRGRCCTGRTPLSPHLNLFPLRFCGFCRVTWEGTGSLVGGHLCTCPTVYRAEDTLWHQHVSTATHSQHKHRLSFSSPLRTLLTPRSGVLFPPLRMWTTVFQKSMPVVRMATAGRADLWFFFFHFKIWHVHYIFLTLFLLLTWLHISPFPPLLPPSSSWYPPSLRPSLRYCPCLFRGVRWDQPAESRGAARHVSLFLFLSQAWMLFIPPGQRCCCPPPLSVLARRCLSFCPCSQHCQV